MCAYYVLLHKASFCLILQEHLPRGTDHEWIKKTFTEYGKVMYVSLPKYHTTGDIKGFAFVEFETEAEAQKACQVSQSLVSAFFKNNIFICSKDTNMDWITDLYQVLS